MNKSECEHERCCTHHIHTSVKWLRTTNPFLVLAPGLFLEMPSTDELNKRKFYIAIENDTCGVCRAHYFLDLAHNSPVEGAQREGIGNACLACSIFSHERAS